MSQKKEEIKTVITKAFICHAKEDKERFVLDFATKLREKGIDAWLDVWEMLPGDSLVDKIFAEGIPNAQAVIVVVSEHSVNKPWVREELNLSVVRKVNGDSKLIPVIIGNISDSQIPEVLKSTIWERINDLNDYDAELARVVRQIYGHSEKPPLGPPPAYIQAPLDTITGLTKEDSLILKMSCEELLQTHEHRHSLVQPKRPEGICELAESMGIDQNTTLESLEVLDSKGYIKSGGYKGDSLLYFTVTDFGFEQYARAYLPNYDSLTRDVALQILNHNKQSSEDTAEALEQPRAVVEHIIAEFEHRNYVDLAGYATGGTLFILRVKPELKRWLHLTS
jgi:hypothetical protein